MKLTHFIAAGLLMVGIGASSEASAQRWDGYSQNYRGDRDGRGWDRRDDRRWDRRDNRRWDRRHRGWDRGHHRGWNRGWDRGRQYGWRNGRGDCRTVWRYGERYRICR